MLKALLRIFGRASEAAPAAAAPITGVSEFLSPGPPHEDGHSGRPVPRWPEYGAAMVAVPPATLLETQRDLIKSIRQSSPLQPSQFDAMLMPMLERYAAWVHLLPASESHHHCGPGGLLAHGLEVAMHAARMADGKTVGIELAPSERAAYEPRWRVAACIGGLCHDLGKPLVDVGATDPEHRISWPSHAGPLYTWLREQQLAHYRFYWRPGQRHERHKPIGTAVAREIIGQDLLTWLSDEPTHDVVELMMLSIAQGKTSGNLMSQIISQADAMSVEADLKRLAEKTRGTGQGAGNHVAALIMQELRTGVEDGRYQINVEGGPLWFTTEGLFGLYPTVLDLVMPALTAKQINGVPASRADIAKLLGETGFIARATGITAEGVEGQQDTWDLTLKIQRRDAMMVPTLRALRFARAEYVMGALPPVPPVEATAAPPFVTKEALDQAMAEIRVVGDAPTGTDTTPPATAPAAAGVPADRGTASSLVEADGAADSTPVVIDHRNRDDRSFESSREGLRQRGAAIAEASMDYKAIAEKIVRAGPEGAAVLHVLDRLAQGKLVWGTDACDSFDGLAVRYPEAFNRTGIPAADLLSKSAKEGWIVVDAGSDRKVQDIEYPSGTRHKSVVFTGLVRQAWLLIPKGKAAPPTPANDATAAPNVPPAARPAPADAQAASGAPPAQPTSQPRRPAPPPRADRPEPQSPEGESAKPGGRPVAGPNGATSRAQASGPAATPRPSPSTPAPAAPVDRDQASLNLLPDTDVAPTPEMLACDSATQLNDLRRMQIRGACYAHLLRQGAIEAPGKQLVEARHAWLKVQAGRFAETAGVPLKLLGIALCDGVNPLLLSASGKSVLDFVSIYDLTINPSYQPPSWARLSQGDRA